MKLTHASWCKEPLNEHRGDEVCLLVVEDEILEPEQAKVSYYKRGPQGNLVSDYRADFLKRYGPSDSNFKLGTPGLVDKRVVFDATEVGTMLLADRASKRNGETHIEIFLVDPVDPDEEDRGF